MSTYMSFGHSKRQLISLPGFGQQRAYTGVGVAKTRAVQYLRVEVCDGLLSNALDIV